MTGFPVMRINVRCGGRTAGAFIGSEAETDAGRTDPRAGNTGKDHKKSLEENEGYL